MAHATSFDNPTQPPVRNNRIVVVGVDRSKQFKRARRHTFLVRTLRYVLPTLTIGSVALYGVSALLATNWTAETALRTIAKILPENIAMQNPHYEGFTGDGGTYFVEALTANQDLKKPFFIKLNTITGVLTDAKNVKTNLKSAHGTFDSRNSTLRLGGGIDIVSEDGTKAKLSTAIVQPKVGVIASNEPVVFEMPGGKVNSDKLRVWQKKKLIAFTGNVRTQLTPPENTQTQGQVQTPGPSSSTSLMGNSSEPVDITSAQLRVDRGQGVANFIGNVKAVQGDQSLQSNTMAVYFAESADGNAQPDGNATATPLGGGSSRVTRIEIPQPLIMRRGALEQMTGDKATFDVLNDKSKIEGNVVMSSGPDRKAVAETADIDSKADTILLSGNVVVTQGQNEIRGDHLFVDRAKGLSRLTNQVKTGPNAGRISARLIREGAGGKTAAAKPAAKTAGNPVAKAAEAGSALSATAFKSDPGAPTDITSVRLDVDDQNKKAIFSGDVRVDQGQMSMRANTITAFYDGNSSLIQQDTQPASPKAAEQAGAQLKRIRADGKVFIKSRNEGQTASGDWADIDMVKNTVHLGGDVVLNQGKNVIRATSLMIDMKTGNAVVETSPDAANAGWASTLVQPSRKGSLKTPIRRMRGGRPSAVFYPTQITKSADKSKKSKPAKPSAESTSGAQATPRRPAASSWEATTDSSGQ